MGKCVNELQIDPRLVKTAGYVVLLGFMAVVVLLVYGFARLVGVL